MIWNPEQICDWEPMTVFNAGNSTVADYGSVKCAVIFKTSLWNTSKQSRTISINHETEHLWKQPCRLIIILLKSIYFIINIKADFRRNITVYLSFYYYYACVCSKTNCRIFSQHSSSHIRMSSSSTKRTSIEYILHFVIISTKQNIYLV